jgi:hypothetical protein
MSKIKKISKHVYLTPDVEKKFQRLAYLTGMKFSDLICLLIENEYERASKKVREEIVNE